MDHPSPVFANTRRVSAGILIGFLLLHLSLKAYFFSPVFLGLVADPVYNLTAGVVTHASVASIVEMVILVAFLMIAGLTLKDFGLDRADVWNGVVVTIFLWALAQALMVVVGLADHGTLYFGRPWWMERHLVFAGVIQSVFANALVEEIVFRGTILPQVFLLLLSLRKWSWSRCLVVAAVVSQVYFALCHVPSAARMGLGAPEITAYLLQAFFVGLLFVAIYVRTGNLFVAAGVHGLLNFSASLFEVRVDESVVIAILSCAVLIGWPYLTRVMGNVFTLELAADPEPVPLRAGLPPKT